MNLLEKLMVKIGLKRDVGAPVHAGVNPVYFTDVYNASDGWAFSWRTSDHKQGEIKFGLPSRDAAELLRKQFTETMQLRLLATLSMRLTKQQSADRLAFRKHLNESYGNQHRNGRFKQLTRPYGDYLYAQDREKFEMEFKEWQAKIRKDHEGL